MATIINTNQIAEVVKGLHSQKKSIVLTGGCFDIIHIGHITLLENSKKEGDVLFVMLESDDAIKEKKGIDRPIHNQEQRAHILSSFNFVDYIVLLPSKMRDGDYDNLIAQISPNIIATTTGDILAFHKERQAKKINAKLVFVNHHVENISSTQILSLLSKEV